MQGTKNLTKGPINRQLFNLAIPIMATSFIQMAYSLTDMAWVGRLGSEAVAAVGAVGILTWISGSIALLNNVGSEVSVGQSIGTRSEQAHFCMLGSPVISICRSYPAYIRTERAYHTECRNLPTYCLNRITFRIFIGRLHRNIQCGRTKQDTFLHQWYRIDNEYHTRPVIYLRFWLGNSGCSPRHMVIRSYSIRYFHLSATV